MQHNADILPHGSGIPVIYFLHFFKDLFLSHILLEAIHNKICRLIGSKDSMKSVRLFRGEDRDIILINPMGENAIPEFNNNPFFLIVSGSAKFALPKNE